MDNSLLHSIECHLSVYGNAVEYREFEKGLAMEDAQTGFRSEKQRAQDLYDFLDEVDGNPSIARYRQRMLEMCPIKSGDTVLDVGCGLGHETTRLANHVGPSGSVIGADLSQDFIAEATRRAEESGRSVEFKVGDARDLPFEDGSFNLCRSERVLVFFDDPMPVLSEMVRVLGPGGHIAVFDFDLGGQIIDSDDDALTRQIEQLMIEAWPGGYIGRRLPALFRQLGLVDVLVEPAFVQTSVAILRRLLLGPIQLGLDDGRIKEAEVDSWWAGLERAERAGRHCAPSLGFIVCGRKI